MSSKLILILFIFISQFAFATDCTLLLQESEIKTVELTETIKVDFRILSPSKKRKDQIFVSPEDVTLVGASAEGHFYLVHEGRKIHSRPFSKTKVVNTSDFSRGVIVVLKGLGAEQKQKLTNAIDAHKNTLSISCSSCVTGVLKDSGIQINKVNFLNRIWSENTFKKILTEGFKDQNGNTVETEMIETSSEISKKVLESFGIHDINYTMKAILLPTISGFLIIVYYFLGAL